MCQRHPGQRPSCCPRNSSLWLCNSLLCVSSVSCGSREGPETRETLEQPFGYPLRLQLGAFRSMPTYRQVNGCRLIRSSPTSAQFRIPGSSARSACSRWMFSLPRNDRVSVVMTNLEAIAPLESPNAGSSLEMIMNRVGSRTLTWSRNLQLTVMASSPEIDSSRSMTVRESVLLPSRASPITASDLPSNGARPNSAPRLDSVGLATWPCRSWR